MKKYIILAILASSLMLSSCDKWLSATSTTTLPAEELFSTPDGFYNALTGVYIQFSDKSLYGGGYSCMESDLTAYPYVKTNDGVYTNLHDHNYDNIRIKYLLRTIWAHTYTTIANINMILRQLEEKGDVLRSDEERDLFYGELYALRAMLHFELLRYWGLESWDGQNADKVTVPYCTEYTKEVTPQLSYSNTVTLLEKDILNAMDYLKNDPVTGWSSDEFESVCNTDGYWNNRVRHMNFYAVKMLAARFYMWKKDYTEAKSYAQEVIDAVFDKGVVSWADVEELLLPHSNAEEIDHTLTSEHVFGIECQNLSSYSINFYTEMNLIGIYIPIELVNTILYPSTDPITGSVAGAEDIRGTALCLRLTGSGYMNFKLYNTNTSAYKHSNIIPIMKISECYYILAECAIRDDDADTAIDYLNIVRHNRGIGDDLAMPVDASYELDKEYYREFVNEGQIFPYLKRMGKGSIFSEFHLEKKDLIWPYPQAEIDYGRIQEL